MRFGSTCTQKQAFGLVLHSPFAIFAPSFRGKFMKNKLLYTFLFTLLVVAGLFAMHFLPSVSFCGKPLRKVDLLSDIRIKKEIVAPVDSDTLGVAASRKACFCGYLQEWNGLH